MIRPRRKWVATFHLETGQRFKVAGAEGFKVITESGGPTADINRLEITGAAVPYWFKLESIVLIEWRRSWWRWGVW